MGCYRKRIHEQNPDGSGQCLSPINSCIHEKGIPVNCISCKDTSYQKKIPYAYGDEDSTQVHAALEFMQPLRKVFKLTNFALIILLLASSIRLKTFSFKILKSKKTTIGPYRSYELDTLRKLSKKGQPISHAINNKEVHRRRVNLEEEAKSRRMRMKVKRSAGGSHTKQQYQTNDDFNIFSADFGSSACTTTPKHSSQDLRSQNQAKSRKVPPSVTKQAASVDQLAIEEVLLYSTNGTVYRGAK